MFKAEGVYHIYNRANGNENLFREEKNYAFFLEKYSYHISSMAETFAWCLMPNHFHLMVRIRPEAALREAKAFQKFQTFGKLEPAVLSNIVSKQFSNLFSSYTQAYNKVYQRRGSLFQPNMKRKEVIGDGYFTKLVLYIHSNAVKHGFVAQLWDWPYSSYHQYRIAAGEPGLNKEIVLQWFGGLQPFERAHETACALRSVFE